MIPRDTHQRFSQHENAEFWQWRDDSRKAVRHVRAFRGRGSAANDTSMTTDAPPLTPGAFSLVGYDNSFGSRIVNLHPLHVIFNPRDESLTFAGSSHRGQCIRNVFSLTM